MINGGATAMLGKRIRFWAWAWFIGITIGMLFVTAPYACDEQETFDLSSTGLNITGVLVAPTGDISTTEHSDAMKAWYLAQQEYESYMPKMTACRGDISREAAECEKGNAKAWLKWVNEP